MRLEIKAIGVGYARLTKNYIAKIKQDLVENRDDVWPDTEGEIVEYSGWWDAPDEDEEILVYTDDGEEYSILLSGLEVLKFRVGDDGIDAVGTTRLSPGIVDTVRSAARSCAAKMQKMNAELTLGMRHGAGFVCFRADGGDVTLVIDVDDMEEFRPERDVALIVLRTSLGDCVQEHFLGLLVRGHARAWREEASEGGDAYRNSYYDEQGKRFMEFVTWGQGGEVKSYLDEDWA